MYTLSGAEMGGHPPPPALTLPLPELIAAIRAKRVADGRTAGAAGDRTRRADCLHCRRQTRRADPHRSPLGDFGCCLTVVPPFFTPYHGRSVESLNPWPAFRPTPSCTGLQEIFIALVRSLDSYQQRSRFNTWLYTIVNRQIADFYRRRSRSERGQNIELDSEGAPEIPSTSEHDSADQRLLIQKALNTLPEHYQEVIMMRFADGLTFAEIAEQRGQSLEAVKSLYRRALQAVRENMGEV